MYPELHLNLFGWPMMLRFSGVFYALGFLAGVWVWHYLSQKAKLPAEKVFDFAVGIIVFGFLGARILYVVEFSSEFFSLTDVLKIWRGGLVWFGGFLTAAAYLLVHLYWKHKNEARLFLITAVPAVILGHAVGRIGCFLNGDSFGLSSNLPWAVIFPVLGDGIARHPTQIYEALIYLIIFLFSFHFLKKTDFSVRLAILIMIFYFFARFFIEFLRFHAPGEMFWGNISNSQLISAIFTLVFLIIHLRPKKLDF